MNEQILHIGFNLLREELDVDALNEGLLVYDNFDRNAKRHDPEADHFPVKLQDLMISFCTSGYARVRIGYREITIRKNSFIILFPNKIFQPIESSEDFRLCMIFADKNFFSFPQEYTYKYARDLVTILSDHPSHTLPEATMEEILHLYSLIKNKIREKEHNYRKEIVRNHMLTMFYNIVDVILSDEKKRTTPATHKEKIFYQFLKELEENFRKERSVLFYANKLCLTPKYISTLIHEVSGRTPSDWINAFVLLEAKALLKSTNFTIQQISDQLNFPSQSYFGRYFKKNIGLSPKQYRNQ
ncbi:MAG: helix-turn-helix domain-containing protein [Tannerellaceae bacterium]|nr:helix-turn-helix domain-containing protein [Tannerellaceae bacterium]